MDMKILYDHKFIVVAREGRTCSEIADDLYREALGYFPRGKLATMTQLVHLPDGRARLHIRISSVQQPGFKLSKLIPASLHNFNAANLVPICLFSIALGILIAVLIYHH